MKNMKITVANTVYKKLLVLANTKFVACLPASDFPSENPRPQTRNFPYTNTLQSIQKEKTKWGGGVVIFFNFQSVRSSSEAVRRDKYFDIQNASNAETTNL